MPAVNLLDEPLFPVRWKPGITPTSDAGPHGEVGLRALLEHAHEIETLTVSLPPAHSALLRALYALTARVTGLDEAVEGPDDWLQRRDDLLAAGRLPVSGIDGYCVQRHDRFFLFDPGGRPWMQDPRLSHECDKTAGVNKLMVTRSAGNNHSWFTHTQDSRAEPVSLSDAVMALLAWSFYGPSGKCSARTVNGTKSSQARTGPLRGFLSYHPVGNTLFETLLAGLVPPKQHVRRDSDPCPWEQESLTNPEGAPPPTTGPCSQLTGQGVHALLLVPDGDVVADAYITWSYRTKRSTVIDDDYLIWQVSAKENRYARHADSSRALWRDLDALLLIDPPGQASPRRPAVFEWAHEVSPDLGVRALGFEQERDKVMDYQFVDASTPPVLGHLERRNAASSPAVGQLRTVGEAFGRRLDMALRRAWRNYADAGKNNAAAPKEGNDKDIADAWAEEGAALYWPAAEQEFWARFDRLGSSDPTAGGGLDLSATRSAFLRLALTAFEEATRRVAGTQRGAQAVEAARPHLFGTPA
ncbi:type I-E CRISPR-associated protein Cse1/CasA [Streptomyces sp. P38-E01]|uniref:Type I-E CRISPR-associated protein Cse1/CasA n=1 Tax=Streptomyces tardus TaxID=2780544 RepID=A0A949N8T7_9ACTN|nr:type I-E CRISPR-associated protein Cse1/CasA [Streptomyces tardus]MBU7598911.1 type I-E CRISPR-associated protein Cse1/CasA [Streptomyces tardus]